MNLLEAQQLLREMTDDTSQIAMGNAMAGNPAVGSQGGAAAETPKPEGEGGEVTPESEALNLLRSINSGIAELIPAVKAISGGGSRLAEPEGGEEDFELPEPGAGEDFAMGGEDRYGSRFGSEDFGGGSRELESSRGPEGGREFGSSREFEGRGSREFEGSRGPSVRGRYED